MKLKKKVSVAAVLIGAFLAVGCTGPTGGEGLNPADVNDWVYQLVDVDLGELGASAFDLVVMDYSSDGTETGEWTAAEIDGLRDRGGDQPKIALAYLSIGEAEDYRWYWQPDWEPGNPDWLGDENPDWPGNYLVRFWDPQWQAIVYAYLDKIIAQGFDGVYLDKLDSCWDLEDERESAPADMVAFAKAISDYGESKHNDFVCIVQNAAALADEFPEHPTNVDGIGQEELFFFATDDPRPEESGDDEGRLELEGYLDLFLDAGGIVLTVDYCDDPTNVDCVYQRSGGRGYVPYCTTVELDELRVNPGHEPD
ncbi:MAG TPA: MJ1477/TM1410 family putative glycoside hydrolase [bacterium]|nr:MJ1477/TM1410 family putative glycoside hydrolase [bacterium]